MKDEEDLRRERTFAEKYEEFVDRRYMSFYSLVPRICHTLVNHFLFHNTKWVPEKLKHMTSERLMTEDREFLINKEYLGAYEDKECNIDEPDFIFEFRCKINPKWRYGIWFNESAKNPNDTWLTIFCAHDWDIDKFKPGYFPFERKITLGKAIENIIDYEDDMDILLYDLANMMVLTSHKISSYSIYGGSTLFHQNFLKRYLEKWWYYEVKKPLKALFLENVVGWYANRLYKKGCKDHRVALMEIHKSDLNSYGEPYYHLKYKLYSDLGDSQLIKCYNHNKMSSRFDEYITQTFQQFADTGELKTPFICE